MERYGSVLMIHPRTKINFFSYFSSMSLTKILSTISTAACLLKENKNGEAIRILARDAKRLIMDVLDCPCNNCEISIKSCELTLAHFFQVYFVDTSCIVSEASISPDNAFCFYPKAIVASTIRESVPVGSVINHLAGITMYNMGLGYHREGIQQGNSKLLEKALTMYGAALSSFKLCSVGDIERSLLMAVTINMGHIHSLHFELAKSECCHRFLFDLMEDYCPQTNVSLDVELLSLYRRTLFFASYGLVCAPAA